MTHRLDDRQPDELRPLHFELDFQAHPTASVLVTCGGTRVLCSVSATEGVPRWMRDQKVAGGWLTAEYQMLPGATPERHARETGRSRPISRNQEIQRLISRSLRAALDLGSMPACTLYVDCDVIDADGGTRCAAVTGAAVALELALARSFVDAKLKTWPLRERIAAVSVGVLDGTPVLDLCYAEDVKAEVDMNVVMTAAGRFVEIQGTAEAVPFSRSAMDDMLNLAQTGLTRIFAEQANVLREHARQTKAGSGEPRT